MRLPHTCILLPLLGPLLGAMPAFAVPACPVPGLARQPDGQGVRLHLRGDERRHWLEDDRGYTVLRNPRREWVYAVPDARGGVQPGRALAGRDDPRAMGIPRGLRPPLPAPRGGAAAVGGAGAKASSTGGLRNLVLLVDFPDLPHTWSRDEFDRLFNDKRYSLDGAAGSVRDYFLEVSYGRLSVDSVVTEWIRLDHPFAWYGEDLDGFDVRPAEMVAEALAKLEALGFDFSVLDADGDGEVDGLTVIHAGGGQEYIGNSDDYIWSHQWQLAAPLLYDGKRLLPYHTEPERRGWDSRPNSQGITRIGVICHETGHLLGLPDLYDVQYDSQGAGDFCLMAGGSWNGNMGSHPSHPSAWCRTALGWAKPVPITETGLFVLPAVERDPAIYRLSGMFSAGEYFLVENRQGRGFDRGLPGQKRGLLIWHVDERVYHNNNPRHYHVDLEEAGGIQHLELNQNAGDDADYVRADTQRRFAEDTDPSSAGYEGQPLGLEIREVSKSGHTMKFRVLGKASTGSAVRIQYRYNCGGRAVGGWQADAGFIQGGVTGLAVAVASDTEPAAVYQNMRIGPKLKFRDRDLPDGTYQVRLHLAELFHSQPGARRLDVAVNDAVRVEGLDVVRQAQGWRKALLVTLPVTVRDGQGLKVVVRGTGGTEAILNGLEILGVD